MHSPSVTIKEPYRRGGAGAACCKVQTNTSEQSLETRMGRDATFPSRPIVPAQGLPRRSHTWILTTAVKNIISRAPVSEVNKDRVLNFNLGGCLAGCKSLGAKSSAWGGHEYPSVLGSVHQKRPEELVVSCHFSSASRLSWGMPVTLRWEAWSPPGAKFHSLSPVHRPSPDQRLAIRTRKALASSPGASPD